RGSIPTLFRTRLMQGGLRKPSNAVMTRFEKKGSRGEMSYYSSPKSRTTLPNIIMLSSDTQASRCSSSGSCCQYEACGCFTSMKQNCFARLLGESRARRHSSVDRVVDKVNAPALAKSWLSCVFWL